VGGRTPPTVLFSGGMYVMKPCPNYNGIIRSFSTVLSKEGNDLQRTLHLYIPAVL
jgi:hypothetical protein